MFMRHNEANYSAAETTSQQIVPGSVRSEVQNQIREIQKLICESDDPGQVDHGKVKELPTDDLSLAQKLQAVLMDFSFSC